MDKNIQKIKKYLNEQYEHPFCSWNVKLTNDQIKIKDECCVITFDLDGIYKNLSTRSGCGLDLMTLGIVYDIMCDYKEILDLVELA